MTTIQEFYVFKGQHYAILSQWPQAMFQITRLDAEGNHQPMVSENYGVGDSDGGLSSADKAAIGVRNAKKWLEENV